MKILYVNWAPLWRAAEVGGGVNLYARSMAVKLVDSGHQVFSISSGFAYNFRPDAYIKKGPDFMGVKNYEIFNAFNLAPGFFNYENPQQDVSEPIVESLFEKFLKIIKPDIVHFHNIEGFSAACVAIARKSGAKIIYSLHNYHPVCNQIYLLYRDREICTDFENGKKCLDCISPPAYPVEVMKRRTGYLVNRLPMGDRVWRKITAAAKLGVFRYLAGSVGKISNAVPHTEKKGSGYSRHLLYAKRRKYNIEALNNAHLVHAVSSFVKKFYVSQGIQSALVETCHIGNQMAEIVLNRKFDRSCASGNKPVAGDQPLKIIFTGLASYPKGLFFFLDTLLSMEKKVLKKIDLYIYARGVNELKIQLDLLSEQLFSLFVRDGYEYATLPDILQGKDYGVVPPMWYDNAPQVVFEMMAMKVPVIGAEIGGIPDFVKDMENGLIFKPGSKKDLAEKICLAVEDRDLKMRLVKHIRPMKTPDQHAADLKGFY
ncbi:MAG: glycosyltransferase, partial [Thermodesulfobacteriota bacterium]|nr:glycosyltransferase [Thermodesulfobacteriota bacterium]